MLGSEGQNEEDVGEVTGELRSEEGVEEQSESLKADSNTGSPSSLYRSSSTSLSESLDSEEWTYVGGSSTSSEAELPSLARKSKRASVSRVKRAETRLNRIFSGRMWNDVPRVLRRCAMVKVRWSFKLNILNNLALSEICSWTGSRTAMAD